ncbi:MAG: SsrA-binding protein SmpB [Peptoniphilaceae bacterium]|uniref:SsrA-binding protein SmpB n=1 Tax=Parvimonas sp. TaxID=1944660 RepID=UPI0025CCB696|nr:SsrA-binding protein SmpB [Parvimonas sp.]MCI5997519.1 SsrA-binding protein SmpB [Parvimonas sp.]MDD7764628.1 SsrA-binding protein SmpB [Peptoniphilaceae bacterium]MDY3050604.1 SsrA-binding protein SmpB [Parvimonas sp.]
MRDKSEKIIANNKKARHDYFIENVYEAGISLSGTEVKSIRQGKVSIKESYCMIKNGEIFIINMNISPYDHGNIYNLEPSRNRKLLLTKKEINKLIGQTKEKGYSLIPLNVHLKNGWVKIDIALAQGKKNYDKRESILKREHERKIQHVLKNKYK